MLSQLFCGRRVGAQQPVDQVLQPVGLANDDLRVLAVFGRRQFDFEQLRSPANATQGILDFVRHAANQLAAGLLVRHLPFLARDAQVTVQRLQLNQQP